MIIIMSSFLHLFTHCCFHPVCSCTTVCDPLHPRHTSGIHVNNTFLDILHTASISFPPPPYTCHNDVMTQSQTPSDTRSKPEYQYSI